MFSVITNIYNKKTKLPTLIELFTATGKLNKFFLQIEMFDVCTTGDKSNISNSQKNFFSFPVAVNNSIKISRLIFGLSIFVITENIMKRPVFVSGLCDTSRRKFFNLIRTTMLVRL
jgi:hypothetical protein